MHPALVPFGRVVAPSALSGKSSHGYGAILKGDSLWNDHLNLSSQLSRVPGKHASLVCWALLPRAALTIGAGADRLVNYAACGWARLANPSSFTVRAKALAVGSFHGVLQL